jgi:rhamnosyltransferase subunit B
VVLAVGSGGDVAPLAAVAAALSRRGIATTWMAPQRYAVLTPDGVRFRAAGADDVFESVFNQPQVWTARHGLAESWRYYGAAALATYEQLRRDWSADDTVLVSSSFAVGARLAEEAHGFVNTTVHLSPGVLFSYRRPPRWPAASIPPTWPTWLQAGTSALAERLAIDPTLRRALAPAWKAAGQTAQRRVFSRYLHSPHRTAYLFPDWFATAASDWPASGRHAGFSSPAPLVRETPSAVVAFMRAGSEPLAFITAGTAVAQRPAWVTRCASALLARGMRVLVLGRAGAAPASEAHPRLLFAPPAPLAGLLPHAQLLVHHGGIGTAVDALRSGTPQWLFPSAHDQADNADRLCRLGVARSFSTDIAEQDLAAAAADVLADPQAPAVAALQARLQADPDGAATLAEWVVQDVEQLAARRATRPAAVTAVPGARAPLTRGQAMESL